MTERVLVTGAAGFVGHHLARHLQEQGLIVHGLDRPGVPPPSDLRITWHACDIIHAAQVAEVVGQVQPDYVFHLAALTKSKSLTDLLAVNVLGTQNVLDALVAARPEARVLVAGSSAEYGLVRPDELPIREDHPLRPLSPYGVSKVAQSLLAAQYVYRHNLAVVRTRTFNLTGPGEPDALVCSAFARQIAEIERGLRPPVLKVGNLESARDFVDVRDAVRAYWLVAKHGEPGEVYNVCSGKASPIRGVLEALFELTPMKVEVLEEAQRRTAWDVPIQYGDVTKLRDVTRWSQAVSLQESLRDLMDLWRHQFFETTS
ncbi:MAG: GDP-mannose 4,6-dehydratase [Candidatus Aminicenantales bacterium]